MYGLSNIKIIRLYCNDSIFYLSPKTIELKSIILSGNDLNVNEIIKEIQKNIKDKYELELLKKYVFTRNRITKV